MEVGRADDVEPRCVRAPLDLTEAASDLSSTALVSRPAEDDLGLSLELFGIFDRIADRIDLEDSLVSERLKEGYDFKSASLSAPLSFSALPFEGWFPMVYDAAELVVYSRSGYDVDRVPPRRRWGSCDCVRRETLSGCLCTSRVRSDWDQKAGVVAIRFLWRAVELL